MTWKVHTRKGNGQWECVLRTHDKIHAECVRKATHRGEWESILVCEETPCVNPLPIERPDQYESMGCSVRFFVPTGKFRTLKNGEKREELIPVTSEKIHVKCLRSARAWVYTGTLRNGVTTYSDSRIKAREIIMGGQTRSLKANELKDELTRMMGPDKATVTMMGVYMNKYTKAEYQAIIGA